RGYSPPAGAAAGTAGDDPAVQLSGPAGEVFERAGAPVLVITVDVHRDHAPPEGGDIGGSSAGTDKLGGLAQELQRPVGGDLRVFTVDAEHRGREQEVVQQQSGHAGSLSSALGVVPRLLPGQGRSAGQGEQRLGGRGPVRTGLGGGYPSERCA